MNRRGLFAAVGSYVLWGTVPLYWHMLRSVPSLQIVAHRVIWCAVFVLAWLMLRDGAGWLKRAVGGHRVLPMLAVSSLLISSNWGIYIWSVTHGRVVDASLGYFMNPLASVLLGVLVLHERLNASQWTAVGIAAAGVLWLALIRGNPPWIAISLAASFSLYGLVRKLAAVEALPGLAIESLLMLGPALGVIGYLESSGHSVFGRGQMRQDTLLVLGGVVAALPLVGFAYGARRIPYSLLGFLQYISPTLQLLCGLLLGEELDTLQAIGFCGIWVALAIYALDGWRATLRRRMASRNHIVHHAHTRTNTFETTPTQI